MNETGKQALAAISNYRHKKILEMLYQRKSVSADELATEFGVSKITIRRDLDTLASESFWSGRAAGRCLFPVSGSKNFSRRRIIRPRRRRRSSAATSPR